MECSTCADEADGGSFWAYSWGSPALQHWDFGAFGIERVDATKKFPPKYLIVGGSFFIAYEISLALALGLAESRRQVIEVSLINYLWPCLAAALAVCFGRQRAGWPLLPGLLMSMLGITWILNGSDGFSLIGLYENIRGNPVPYGLAVAAACLWALYCFFARGLAQGTDAIVPFFAGTSLVLWIKFVLGDDPLPVLTTHNLTLLAFTALVLAMGHAAWNKALRIGNLLILAAASYATPVLSSVLSSVVLATPLGFSFWQGVAFVTAGSVLCWIATRRG